MLFQLSTHNSDTVLWAWTGRFVILKIYINPYNNGIAVPKIHCLILSLSEGNKLKFLGIISTEIGLPLNAACTWLAIWAAPYCSHVLWIRADGFLNKFLKNQCLGFSFNQRSQNWAKPVFSEYLMQLYWSQDKSRHVLEFRNPKPGLLSPRSVPLNSTTLNGNSSAFYYFPINLILMAKDCFTKKWKGS